MILTRQGGEDLLIVKVRQVLESEWGRGGVWRELMKTLPGSLTRQPNCSSSGLLFAPRVEVIQFSGWQLCCARQVVGRIELRRLCFSEDWYIWCKDWYKDWYIWYKWDARETCPSWEGEV